MKLHVNYEYLTSNIVWWNVGKWAREWQIEESLCYSALVQENQFFHDQRQLYSCEKLQICS